MPAAWTDRDLAEATRIVDALSAWQSNDAPLIGGLSVAQAARIKGKTSAVRRRRVQYLMPLVAEIVVERYPGYVLSVHPDGPGSWVYRFTEASDARQFRAVRPRVRKARTAFRRARFELPVGHPFGAALAALMIGQESQMDGLLLLIDQAVSDSEAAQD